MGTYCAILNAPFVKVVDKTTAFCLLYRKVLNYEETGNNDICNRCNDCRSE